MISQMTNLASIRGDKESEPQNYEIVCKENMEIGLEICRSYYVEGYNREDEKSEVITMISQMTNLASYRGGGEEVTYTEVTQ
jgi:hypothetical protein